MDLMREEITAMVRVKSPTSANVTYQLPPEKRNIMHDDRAYVFVLACWQIRNLREDEEFGDGVELDYSVFWGNRGDTGNSSNVRWLDSLGAVLPNRQRSVSPFSGSSPFTHSRDRDELSGKR